MRNHNIEIKGINNGFEDFLKFFQGTRYLIKHEDDMKRPHSCENAASSYSINLKIDKCGKITNSIGTITHYPIYDTCSIISDDVKFVNEVMLYFNNKNGYKITVNIVNNY